MYKSVNDLDLICRYQLTVITNLLLLTADKHVRTLSMLSTKTYHRQVNQCQCHTSPKNFPWANTPAFFGLPSVTNRKRFMTLTATGEVESRRERQALHHRVRG
jgi:hypothetical protein